jgi:hypothetical protein
MRTPATIMATPRHLDSVSVSLNQYMPTKKVKTVPEALQIAYATERSILQKYGGGGGKGANM